MPSPARARFFRDHIVRVTLLPSAFPPSRDDGHQYLTSYVINGVVAIDAGSLGLFQTPLEQGAIRHVLISHAHLDHIATLPTFLENAYRACSECVVVHGTETVLDVLRRDVFNGRLWADFIEIAPDNIPFLKLSALKPGETIELAGLRITPVEVNHAVATVGFIVDDGSAAIVIPSDTGPTDEIWKRANRLTHLRAVFLESSFPDSLAHVAAVTGHLCPTTFAREIAKLQRPVRAIAVHLKARHYERVMADLLALRLPDLEIVQPGREYVF